MMHDVHVALHPGLPWQKHHSARRRLFTGNLDFNLRKKRAKCCVWSTALCGAETWTLRRVGQKYVGSSETWCWRRVEEVSWTGGVRSEEVLHRVKEGGGGGMSYVQ
jgi:hypothetical protein